MGVTTMLQKRTPPVVESGGNQEAVVDGVVDGNHHTTDTSQMQGFISTILLAKGATSERDKVLTSELCESAGLSDSRALQSLIEVERERVPIVSGAKGGYWLADPQTAQGRADIAKCSTTLLRRGARTIGTGRKLRRFLGVMPGQELIEGSDE